MITELKSFGKELSGAVYVAKRFQLRKCSHEGKRKSATECILALIGQFTLYVYYTCTCTCTLYMYMYMYLYLYMYMYIQHSCEWLGYKLSVMHGAYLSNCPA